MFLHTVYKVIRILGNCDRQSEFIKCSSHPCPSEILLNVQ